jgi:DNA-binding SARP family transcriptional activator/tetratricopeptide (TPR) repeat protein
MVHGLRFSVLGPLEVQSAGGAVPVTAPRQRKVLATLLARPNRIVQHDTLARAIWGDELPRSARAQIYICISALRQALEGGDYVETHAAGYVLRLDGDALDSQVFERLLDKVSGIDTDAQPKQALRLLDDALALWRGPAFDDVSSPEVEAKAAWLEQRRVSAIEQRVELLLHLGIENAHEIEELCAAHPLRERLHAFLMISLYRSGRQAEALDVYQKVRRMLVKELAIEPGAMLQTIHQAILNQDSVLDLPRTHGAGTSRIVIIPHQLPAPVAGFTGRDDIAERLRAELLYTAGRSAGGPPGPPVVLVTGIAGVGKSALAVHVAHRVAVSFPDGQLFARLDGSTGNPAAPDEVLEWFLDAFGVDAREIPERPERRADLLRSVLGGRRVLIVLDDAASEAQVRPLLPGLLGCGVIVTSRRRLPGIHGVSQWELGTLPDSAARALLEGIVTGGRLRDDRLTAEILAACGGLPLALRIAGLRLASHPHWDAADLVRRIKGAPQALDQFAHGDISVRGSLSGSYAALSPAAQRAFRLLGLLRVPDFAHWAAAAAVGTSPREIELLIDELVESRLLHADALGEGPARYSFHNLTRLFAAELAAAEDPSAGQTEVADDVLRASLTLVRAAQRAAYGSERIVSGPAGPSPLGPADAGELVRDPVAWFRDERATLLALVGHAARTGRHELAWHLAVGCSAFFGILGLFDDWETTHRLALDAAQRCGDERAEAALLCSLGSLSVARGDWTSVGGLLRAMTIFEAVGDTHGRALTLANLAEFDRVNGNCPSAIARYREAGTCFREADDPVGEAYAMSGLAHAYAEAGDLRSAQRLAEESLLLARTMSSPRLEARVLCRLGEVLGAAGRHDMATGHLAEALDQAYSSGDRLAQLDALVALAESHVRRGEFGAADKVLDRVIMACDRIGHAHARARATLARARVLQVRGAFSEAESLITTAMTVFGGNGAATWYDRALTALSDLRRWSGRRMDTG